MADDLFALADLLTINDTSFADLDVTDLEQFAPLMQALPYTPATHGTVHKYTKETGAPVVGFRAANAGRDFDHSEDTAVTATLQILDFSFQVDKAVADAYKRGGAKGWIGREAARHLRAAFFKYENQLINGTITGSGGDTAGFAGFANVLDDSDDAMVVNAGGSSNVSSVYMIRAGLDDVVGVLGNDGAFDLGDSTVINALDGSSMNYPAYYTPGTGYTGLQVGAAKSIGRICNLTTANGEGLTDDRLFELYELFPAGRGPTHIVLNKRQHEQLRKSRTATNATGAPAPMFTEWEGIPLVVTDAITNTETALTVAS
ncbi:MAG: major capsid protein [Planctomycetota bacterium]